MEFDDTTLEQMANHIFTRLIEWGIIEDPQEEDLDFVYSATKEALEAVEVLTNETYVLAGPDDYSDDADALASAGFGTDEDYGYNGDYD